MAQVEVGKSFLEFGATNQNKLVNEGSEKREYSLRYFVRGRSITVQLTTACFTGLYKIKQVNLMINLT